MARPKIEDSKRRGDQLNIRLTDMERVRLEARAASLGLSLTEFMRDRGLGYRMPRRAAQRHADALAIATLNRIGVNLNQITHHLNAGWSSDATGDAVNALLAEIATTMRGLMRGPQADRGRPVV